MLLPQSLTWPSLPDSVITPLPVPGFDLPRLKTLHLPPTLGAYDLRLLPK